MPQSNLSHEICKDRKIYATKNYSVFKFLKENRPNEDYKYLVESIRKKNLLSENPIKIDSSMYVIDGQHRLRAAQELDVEIYFEYSKASKDHIPLLQIQKSWLLSDYAHFYRDEIDDYRYLDSICFKYGLGHAFVMNCCSKKTIGITKMFKDGKYKLDYSKDYLDKKFALLNELKYPIQKVINKKMLKNGLQALWLIMDMENYSQDHLMENIEKYPSHVISSMKFQTMSDIHNSMVLQVYNRNLKDEKKKLKIHELHIKLIRIANKKQLSFV